MPHGRPAGQSSPSEYAVTVGNKIDILGYCWMSFPKVSPGFPEAKSFPLPAVDNYYFYILTSLPHSSPSKISHASVSRHPIQDYNEGHVRLVGSKIQDL